MRVKTQKIRNRKNVEIPTILTVFLVVELRRLELLTS